MCSLASVIDGYSDCKHALCDLFLHCLHLTVLFPSFGAGCWQTTHMWGVGGGSEGGDGEICRCLRFLFVFVMGVLVH